MKSLNRDAIVVNLDPASDYKPYECAIDIADLIDLRRAMEKQKLGPNGGMVYCLQYLGKNLAWLKGRLDEHDDKYVLFDMPGQVELYTHHEEVRAIVESIEKWDYRISVVNLVDAHYCIDPTTFISALLLSLSMMMRLELPHVNILSKIDLLPRYGELKYNLDFYTEVHDLEYLLLHLDESRWSAKYKKLNEAISGVVTNYSLVSFTTLDIQDKHSVYTVLKIVDKSNGYIHLSKENPFSPSAFHETSFELDHLNDTQEKFFSATSDGGPIVEENIDTE